jgi:hypothetical protein
MDVGTRTARIELVYEALVGLAVVLSVVGAVVPYT